MHNSQRIHLSKTFSLVSKVLFIFIGSIIYVSVICIDLPKVLKQGSFALAFVCFVGAFMSGESERIVEDILNLEEDVLAQTQQDLLYESTRPKNLKPMTTIQIPSDLDIPLIPWG